VKQCGIKIKQPTRAYLAHEISNDAVEARPSKSKSWLSSTQLTEVLCGLGDNISAKLHDNTSSGLCANGDIEKDLRISRPVEKLDAR
jgi:hypothetical protein